MKTSISVRERSLLHRLLGRDLRQCSPASLSAAERRGWVLGMSGGYELTAKGRALAERSERADQRGEMHLDAKRDVPAERSTHEGRGLLERVVS